MNASISNSEWAVLECLWASEPLTVTQLAHALRSSVGWAKSTSVTMANRMEQKGLLLCQEGGKAKLYRAALTRADAEARLTRSFLDRVYSGSVGLMVSAMVSREALSPAELAELRAVLDRAEAAGTADKKEG